MQEEIAISKFHFNLHCIAIKQSGRYAGVMLIPFASPVAVCRLQRGSLRRARLLSCAVISVCIIDTAQHRPRRWPRCVSAQSVPVAPNPCA